MIQKSFEIRLYLHLKMVWKCLQFLVFVFFDHLQPWWSGYWEKQWLKIGHLIEVVKLNHWIHRRHNHNYCEILWKEKSRKKYTFDTVDKNRKICLYSIFRAKIHRIKLERNILIFAPKLPEIFLFLNCFKTLNLFAIIENIKNWILKILNFGAKIIKNIFIFKTSKIFDFENFEF